MATQRQNGNVQLQAPNSDLSELTQLLIKQQVRASLPAQQIQVFNGDPLQFTTFMKSFEYGVENKVVDGRDRLNYLWQYTVGEPRTLVNSCLYYQDPEEGYIKAKQILTGRYGNSHKIAQAILQKAKEWPEVKEKASSLNQFSLFLLESYNIMQSNSTLKELDNTGNLQLLVGKLPYRLRGMWRTKVFDIEETMRTIGFKDLVDFVSRHAAIVSNPAFGTISTEDNKSNNRNQQGERSTNTRRFNFATGVESEENSPQKQCLHCETNTHTLEVCRVIQKKPHEDRIDILRKLGVCFGCLKKGTHLAKDCKNRAKCSTCKGKHPTVLHRERPTEKQTVDASTMCGLTGAGGVTSVMSVVPVIVTSKETGRVVKTFALLDSKSTAVFCSNHLRNELAMKGTKTRIKIQTINGVKMLTRTS